MSIPVVSLVLGDHRLRPRPVRGRQRRAARRSATRGDHRPPVCSRPSAARASLQVDRQPRARPDGPSGLGRDDRAGRRTPRRHAVRVVREVRRRTSGPASPPGGRRRRRRPTSRAGRGPRPARPGRSVGTSTPKIGSVTVGTSSRRAGRARPGPSSGCGRCSSARPCRTARRSSRCSPASTGRRARAQPLGEHRRVLARDGGA